MSAGKDKDRMSPYIETARTTLRPFIEADAQTAFEWFGDAEVMRFTPSGPDPTIAQTRERITRYIDHQKHHGFSKWLIFEKESDVPIGDAGLQLLEELGPVPDLGFPFNSLAMGPRAGNGSRCGLGITLPCDP